MFAVTQSIWKDKRCLNTISISAESHKNAWTLTYQRGLLRAEGHVITMACFGLVGEVGIYISSSDTNCCVVAAWWGSIRLAEDANEIRDPLLVALSWQQRHDHQLDAQKHEQVAPFGMDAEHGDSSVSSQQRRSGGGSANKIMLMWRKLSVILHWGWSSRQAETNSVRWQLSAVKAIVDGVLVVNRQRQIWKNSLKNWRASVCS